MFVKNHVCVQEKSRKRSLNEVSRRTFSNTFFLGSPRKRVCKKMFLNTLGVTEWVVKKWAKGGIKEPEQKQQKGEIGNEVNGVSLL